MSVLPRAAIVQRVSPEDIQALRAELKCTARELAETLGLEQKEVLAWETGELFPTKRWVTAMQRLKAAGPTSIQRKPRGKPKGLTGMQRLSDPELWLVIRKLLAHPALFDEVKKLSERYDDAPS